ncbi:hypothetical protein N7G274_005106 [Stereocaulon virgatum]|uniref:Uncharacterized protein n=1 Tax=Stereocaulon virgatum TaxID=373712 RepID=A0ABR4A8U2_9LECA
MRGGDQMASLSLFAIYISPHIDCIELCNISLDWHSVFDNLGDESCVVCHINIIVQLRKAQITTIQASHLLPALQGAMLVGQRQSVKLEVFADVCFFPVLVLVTAYVLAFRSEEDT